MALSKPVQPYSFMQFRSCVPPGAYEQRSCEVACNCRLRLGAIQIKHLSDTHTIYAFHDSSMRNFFTHSEASERPGINYLQRMAK